MAKPGKSIGKARAQVEKRPYPLQEAVPLLQKVKYAKFDETVELVLNMNNVHVFDRETELCVTSAGGAA